MSQYLAGTATVTNGSPTVTGTNTLWLANVTAGDSFTVAGDGVMYDVASVDSDTQITLSVNYAGVTASGVVYAIGTGFTVPDSFPEMSQGDIETATIFTRAIRKIQTKFNTFIDQAALANAQIFMSVAAGITGTISGEFFFAVSGTSYALYINDNGEAVEQVNFATFAEVDALKVLAAESADAASTSETNASDSADAAANSKALADDARDTTLGYRDETKVHLDNAAAVVTGGTATLEPEAGKIPLANSTGFIDLKWLDTSILRNAVRASANLVWDSVSDDYSREYVTSGVTPIHEAMRRCVVRDDKTVAYYLDPNDSNLKADGTASDLTGTDGQVMVEIRKFYVRISKLLNGKYKREISEVHQSGFVVHPAFAIGGTLQYDQSVGMWHYFGNTGEKSVTYVGAYQASVYSASGATHIDGLNLDNNDSRVDTATDTLASVSGNYPMVGLTRDQFRTVAANRGSGWSQWSFWQLQAVKLLFFIEYGSFDGQAALAEGNVNVSAGYPSSSSDQTDSPHSVSGKSDTAGNGSGGVDSSTRDTAWLSYRGIENFWGNAWQWCDGWNINDQQFYVSNDSVLFADNTATGYGLIGEPAPASNGYIRNVQHQTLGDVPSDISGNSSTAFADKYYQSSGWRVAPVGGSADYGAYSGPSCVKANNSSGLRYRLTAGRLAIA